MRKKDFGFTQIYFNSPPVCMDCGKNLAECNPPEQWKCGYCGKSGENRKFMENHKCNPPEHEESWEKKFDEDFPNETYDGEQDGYVYTRTSFKDYIRDNFVSKEKIKREIDSLIKTEFNSTDEVSANAMSSGYRFALSDLKRSLGLGD